MSEVDYNSSQPLNHGRSLFCKVTLFCFVSVYWGLVVPELCVRVRSPAQ